MIKVKLFGGLKIFIKDLDITHEFSSKGLCIIAYLLITNREMGVKRDKLASFFWTDNKDAKAKYNLRHALWSMKKSLAKYNIPEIIKSSRDKQYCILNSEIEIKSDVDGFIEIEKRKIEDIDTIKEITMNYTGEFLNDFYIRENINFDDWLILNRERFLSVYYNAMIEISNSLEESAKYNDAIDILQILIRLNSLDENIHEKIIKLYIKTGNRVSAIHQYERCESILRQELNISPSYRLTQLYQSIVSQNTVCNSDVQGNDIEMPYGALRKLIVTLLKNKNMDFIKLPDNIKMILNTILFDKYPSDAMYVCANEGLYDFQLFKAIHFIGGQELNKYRDVKYGIRDIKFDLFWNYIEHF